MHVKGDGSIRNLIFPAAMRGDLTFCVDNIQYQVAVPMLSPNVHDELVNSSLGFLRLIIMMDFLVFNDIIHAGAILKRVCPTFNGLKSDMLRYAIECVNLIIKLEWVLSERETVKVTMLPFVNPTGKPWRNKPIHKI
jgi:hypothetical protein